MSAISRRAAGLAAVLLCAGVLAGCAAPASESAAGPTPEPESLAASTTLDANRREPIDPEYLTQLAVAAERAANYWQMVLDENAIRYITTRVGMSGVVDPADDEEAADLLDNTDAGSGTDYRTKIDDGEAFLVKVSCGSMAQLEHLILQFQKLGTTSTQIILSTPVNHGDLDALML